MEVAKVVLTPEAAKLIQELKALHPDFIFYQSCGCCDGSIVYVYDRSDFKLGDNDICLGCVGGVEFYMHKKQYEYQKHTQLILSVKPIDGSEFSLEYGMGKSFELQSRLFSPEELEELQRQV
ncbi:acetaldehyde dehydrogenase (plasmid) [Helicobacter sp. NHP19-012]|uniref:Acetaldehyde dehydrogenase n=1 Tax=Helicobacter gastrofelis TaxID=2849642 RepID=A0ABM7SGF3_9HELI|nr:MULTISPECIES: DUF779 domain-containing protein [unclassified Helicobacter]BCZ20003.1 acetaldehyde dehydrogenase [Helicobacter sp. NHP19-012]GMB96967.1 DUF779 domain-containing protein [Helicobacter sp. NHP22-001]